MNVELREMTNRPETWDSAVMRSSVIPSEKASCCGSPLMLTNGSTAIDGLSGSGRAMRSIDAGSILGSHGRCQAAMPAANTATSAAAAGARRQCRRALWWWRHRRPGLGRFGRPLGGCSGSAELRRRNGRCRLRRIGFSDQACNRIGSRIRGFVRRLNLGRRRCRWRADGFGRRCLRCETRLRA